MGRSVTMCEFPILSLGVGWSLPLCVGCRRHHLPLAVGAIVYLVTVIDCYSPQVAGWAIADHMRTELAPEALKAADALQGGLAGAKFHTDHKRRYNSRSSRHRPELGQLA